MLTFLANLLRTFAYLFESVLCLMGLLFAFFASSRSNLGIGLGWLPWTGHELIEWIVALSVIGLLTVVIAAAGYTRWLLAIFSAVVLVLLMRGLFLSPQYVFHGGDDAKNAAYLVAGAALALLGSVLPARRSQKRKGLRRRAQAPSKAI